MKDYEEPASELLLNLIHGGGTTVATCCCGRTHFATYNSFLGDEATVSLRDASIKEPNRYIEHNDQSSIYLHDGLGVIYVGGCPCNGIRPYEDFLLNNRFIIVEFYRALTARALQDAVDDMTRLELMQKEVPS